VDLLHSPRYAHEMHRKTIVLVLAAVFSSVAFADSTEEKNWRASEETNLKQPLETMNKQCGTSITEKIDWSTFRYDRWQSQQAGMKCASVVWAVRDICYDAGGKAAVAKTIKSITCKVGENATAAVKGSELDFELTIDKTPSSDFVKDVLKRL
jgi:hypothetical protein